MVASAFIFSLFVLELWAVSVSLPVEFLLYLFVLAPMLHETQFKVSTGQFWDWAVDIWFSDPHSWPFSPIPISPLVWIPINYLFLASGLWCLFVCSSTCHVFAPAFLLYVLATYLYCYWILVLAHMSKVLWRTVGPQNTKSFHANSALIALKLLRALPSLSKQNTFSEGS